MAWLPTLQRTAGAAAEGHTVGQQGEIDEDDQSSENYRELDGCAGALGVASRSTGRST